MPDYSIGVDLGGTNLRIAAVSTDGQLLEKVTVATRIDRGARSRNRRHVQCYPYSFRSVS